MISAQPDHAISRLVGLGLVIALHIALVYALVESLARRPAEPVVVPIETKLIEAPQQEHVEPPPPPPPDFKPPPPPFVPPPEIHIEAPPPPPKSTAITVVTPVKPAEPAPLPREPVKVTPHIDAAKSQEPEYPPISRRLGEQGSVTLEVLVDGKGQVIDEKLVESSGHERLDQAALAGVKANYRFVPGTVDGVPQDMWYRFKFTWKLR
jgi:periplasmic protein TonB